jgi:hypothetical protein
MVNENYVDKCIEELQSYCEHLLKLCNVEKDQDGKATAISCATQSMQLRIEFLQESKADFEDSDVDGIALCLDNLNDIIKVLTADLERNGEDNSFSRAFSVQMRTCIAKIKSVRSFYEKQWLGRIYNS